MRDLSLSDKSFEDLPEGRASSPKGGRAGSPAWPPKQQRPRRGMFDRRRLGAYALVAIGGLALVGVPMNALFFQDGRHPAPLFSTHLFTPPKSQTAETPTPPARPAKMEATTHEAEPVKADLASKGAPKAVARTEPAKVDPLSALLRSDSGPAAPVARPEKKREPGRDQIGALLGSAAKPAAPPAVAASPAASTDRNVISAQRALQRLGYVVKPDGLVTPALRKTIENFERDSSLPVTGELSPKVLKAIAQRASAGRQQ